MTLFEIAIGTMLRIPDGWDEFVYRGYRYKRGADRRFVRMELVA